MFCLFACWLLKTVEHNSLRNKYGLKEKFYVLVACDNSNEWHILKKFNMQKLWEETYSKI